MSLFYIIGKSAHWKKGFWKQIYITLKFKPKNFFKVIDKIKLK